MKRAVVGGRSGTGAVAAEQSKAALDPSGRPPVQAAVAVHAGIAAVLLGACAPPKPARYASWEPTMPEIPSTSHAEALRRLAVSRRLYLRWKEGPEPDIRKTGRTDRPPARRAYTYVRAYEYSDNRVEFTLVAVEGGRVVLRALVRGDPDRLDGLMDRETAVLESLWVERGNQLGTHDDGAPPLTIDQLYDRCEQTIEAHPELTPRLYFHPNGILMHCGFLPDDCSSCPTITLQSFSRLSVAGEAPPEDPAKWICTRPWGAFIPGSDNPMMSRLFACQVALRPEGRRRSPHNAERGAPGPDALPPSALERKSHGEDLGRICKIDPAACPDPCDSRDCTRATWTRWLPSMCFDGPARDPRPLDVGKVDPLAPWTFPFSGSHGVECEGGTFERRVVPRDSAADP